MKLPQGGRGAESPSRPLNSPAGSCVWYVVGLQVSIREWATRRGWGGRSVRHEPAQGILGAAHYGYEPSHQKLGV